MAELFSIFKQHLVWSLALWLLVFTVFALVFAGGNLTALATGLFRLVLSLITSPLVFLRRATQRILERTDDDKSEQYLLGKALLVVQALIIVGAIGALAAGVVATWNVLLPPREVRDQAREHRTRVEEQRVKVTQANDAVTALDQEWTTKEKAAMERFRNQRQATINDTTRDMKHIETTLETYGSGNAKSVLARMKEHANSSSRDAVRYAHTSMRNTVSSYWYWLEDWSRSSLRQWCDLWRSQKTAELDLREMTAGELRATEQPEFTRASARRDSESETLQARTRTQEQFDEAASLKWKAAALTAGGSFVTILVFLWIAGLLVEAGSLGIRIANDVRRLREAPPRPVYD